MPITLERIPHDKQVAVYTLHQLGYSLRKISKAVGISLPVVWMATKQLQPNPNDVETFKKGLLLHQYGISQRAINRISDEKLDAMNALQLMTINAIGIDKARDMEGSNRPVFNLVTVVNETTKANQHIQSQLAALEARKLALQSQRSTTVE